MPYKDKNKLKKYAKNYNKEYYLKNKEVLKEKQRQKYKENPELVREQKRKSRLKYIEKHKAYAKEYRKNNIEKARERSRIWRENNRERFNERSRLYRQENYDKIYQNLVERKKEDKGFHFLLSSRTRIHHTMKRTGTTKNLKTMELLGVPNLKFFREHLKKQFKKGMTLENYGEWHIDHIIPCASFDLTKPSEQKKCFHYTNLQPLWAVENLQKGARLEWRKS